MTYLAVSVIWLIHISVLQVDISISTKKKDPVQSKDRVNCFTVLLSSNDNFIFSDSEKSKPCASPEKSLVSEL